MTTGPTLPERPQLRPIEVSRISHEGSDFFLLKDPRQLNDQSLVVPVALGGYLQSIDGTNTVDEIIEKALAVGAPTIPREILDDLLGRLDEVFLLANGAYVAEMQGRLNEYRDGPSRKPALADLAYPGDPDDLRAYLDGLAFPYILGNNIKDATNSSGNGKPSGVLQAIISPHIDFERGGDSYAMIWEQVRGDLKDVELFVVFGTDHNGDGPRLTLTHQNYATPIGELATDTELVGELASILSADTSVENHPFADEFNHASEHSIELATVWLHRALGATKAKMLPVLCGSFGRLLLDDAADLSDHREISASINHLKEIAAQRRTVFVAAADLAHMGPAFGDENPLPLLNADRKRVQSDDEELLMAITQGNRRKFFDLIKAESDGNKICGLAPIYMTLWAAEAKDGIWNGYQQCQADEADTSFVSIAGAALYG